MATPADLVTAASRAGAQVKKMPSSGVYGSTPNRFADKVGRARPAAPPAGDAARAGATRDPRDVEGTGRGFDGKPFAPPPAPPTIQGREVTMGPNGPSITGDNGGTQQLGAAAMRRLGGVPGGGPPPPGPGRGITPPPVAPPDAEMANKLRGFKLATGGPVYAPGDAGGGFQGIDGPKGPPQEYFGGDEMAMSVNARPALQGALDAYERGPQAEGLDMPAGPPSGAAGLFDSLGRVGAGLPPGGARPRPMPFSRPAGPLGGL